MTDTDSTKHQKNLRDTLAQVKHLLEKQALVVEMVRRQEDMRRRELVQTLVEKQHLAELGHRLGVLHPADLAYILESLPLHQRKLVWQLIKYELHGAVLLELADAVREQLIAELGHQEIVKLAAHLDSDELADLAADLPQETLAHLLATMNNHERTQLQTVLSFPEECVGSLMNFDMVTVREDVDLEVVLRYLRLRGELSTATNQLFVVDRSNVLRGTLLLKDLLIHTPDKRVADIMNTESIYFYTDEPAKEAALAFERYDLLSAPVVNNHQQLVGCITVDAVVDFIHSARDKEMLSSAGLQDEEDLFAPWWRSAQNRWVWLGLNLLTAFTASRVIGAFEATIEQLVALAALMPIVASLGGNTGNQTVALMIRGLALNQITQSNISYLLLKEMGISVVNGFIWGSIMGLITFLLYWQLGLALVMSVAMILNLLVAALSGVFIPLLLHRFGRDPVMGSSVILTALTDAMGFFIFLGLASVVLL